MLREVWEFEASPDSWWDPSYRQTRNKPTDAAPCPLHCRLHSPGQTSRRDGCKTHPEFCASLHPEVEGKAWIWPLASKLSTVGFFIFSFIFFLLVIPCWLFCGLQKQVPSVYLAHFELLNGGSASVSLRLQDDLGVPALLFFPFVMSYQRVYGHAKTCWQHWNYHGPLRLTSLLCVLFFSSKIFIHKKHI